MLFDEGADLFEGADFFAVARRGAAGFAQPGLAASGGGVPGLGGAPAGDAPEGGEMSGSGDESKASDHALDLAVGALGQVVGGELVDEVAHALAHEWFGLGERFEKGDAGFAVGVHGGRGDGADEVAGRVEVVERFDAAHAWPTLCTDDARRLIEGSVGRWRALWAIAICLGLRRGELFALRREDVDLHARSLLVRRSHDREQTKNGIDRLLPCTDELWAIVEPYLSTLPAGGLVFPGRAGRRLHRDYKLPRRLREDLRRAGVETPEGFRAHDLRHTFATLATESGMAPDVIRLTLGHAGGVTAGYQHISLEAHRRELSKLSLYPHTQGVTP